MPVSDARSAAEEQDLDFRELLDILRLKPVGDDVFVGAHPSKNPTRTFGGQLMAQAIVAGARTLTTGVPLSTITVHFVNGGDPDRDLEFHVQRLRDERRFANRRVDTIQNGSLITTTLLSYLDGGPGLEHDPEAPTVPGPEALPGLGELLSGYEKTLPGFLNAPWPIDWRYTNDPAWVMRDRGGRLDYNRVWVKPYGDPPDDPVLHTALLAYASDTTVLDSIITTHGLSWGTDRIFAVSANHSMWFHRPIRFDDWVLYSTGSPAAADSRGLGTGHIFSRSGQVLATVVQEGIIKYFPPRSR